MSGSIWLSLLRKFFLRLSANAYTPADAEFDGTVR